MSKNISDKVKQILSGIAVASSLATIGLSLNSAIDKKIQNDEANANYDNAVKAQNAYVEQIKASDEFEYYKNFAFDKDVKNFKIDRDINSLNESAKKYYGAFSDKYNSEYELYNNIVKQNEVVKEYANEISDIKYYKLENDVQEAKLEQSEASKDFALSVSGLLVGEAAVVASGAFLVNSFDQAYKKEDFLDSFEQENSQ